MVPAASTRLIKRQYVAKHPLISRTLYTLNTFYLNVESNFHHFPNNFFFCSDFTSAQKSISMTGPM